MPGFDIDAARKAGYSDDEILAHLTQSRGFDVAGALKSGYSKPEIIAHLSSSPAMPPAGSTLQGGGKAPGFTPKPPPLDASNLKAAGWPYKTTPEEHLKDMAALGAQAALATPLSGGAMGEGVGDLLIDKGISAVQKAKPIARAIGAGTVAAAEKVPIVGPIGKAFIGAARGSLQGPPPKPGPTPPGVQFRPQPKPVAPPPVNMPSQAAAPSPVAPPPVTFRPEIAAPGPVEAPPVRFRPEPTAPAPKPVSAPPVGRMRSAPEPEAANTVTSPETASTALPVDRAGMNNLVHGLGARLGIDHDMMSAIAAKRYGVRSMMDMSHEQMVDLYATLLKGGVPAAGEPLPLKSTGKPSEMTLEEQLRRSLEHSKNRAKSTEKPAEEIPDITKFAKGGVIKKPHLLMDAKTGKVDGLMAENGPERISPITKGPDAQDLATRLKRKGFGRS